jgi:hypothetical protein
MMLFVYFYTSRQPVPYKNIINQKTAYMRKYYGG